MTPQTKDSIVDMLEGFARMMQFVILAEPTGAVRNALTEVNIHILTASRILKDTPTNEQGKPPQRDEGSEG